jgi:hypothetical protein
MPPTLHAYSPSSDSQRKRNADGDESDDESSAKRKKGEDDEGSDDDVSKYSKKIPPQELPEEAVRQMGAQYEDYKAAWSTHVIKFDVEAEQVSHGEGHGPIAAEDRSTGRVTFNPTFNEKRIVELGKGGKSNRTFAKMVQYFRGRQAIVQNHSGYSNPGVAQSQWNCANCLYSLHNGKYPCRNSSICAICVDGRGRGLDHNMTTCTNPEGLQDYARVGGPLNILSDKPEHNVSGLDMTPRVYAARYTDGSSPASRAQYRETNVPACYYAAVGVITGHYPRLHINVEGNKTAPIHYMRPKRIQGESIDQLERSFSSELRISPPPQVPETRADSEVAGAVAPEAGSRVEDAGAAAVASVATSTIGRAVAATTSGPRARGTANCAWYRPR